MESQYSVQAGKSLQQSTLGFPAYGLVVENITNQWYYEPSRRRFIPPYQAGVTIPLIGSATGSLDCRSPGNIVQVGPIPSEYVTVSYTDMPVAAGGGVNVNTGLPVTVSAVDLTEGGQPGNPLGGLIRLWADVSGFLHRLSAAGVDAQLVDSLTPAGGFLSGTYPNPGFAVGAAVANIGAGTLNATALVEGSIDGADLAALAVDTPALALTAVHNVISDTVLATDLWSNVALSAGDNGFAGYPLTVSTSARGQGLLVFLRASVLFNGPAVTTTMGWDFGIQNVFYKPLSRTAVTSGVVANVSVSTVLWIPKTAYSAGAAQQFGPLVFAANAIPSGMFLRASSSPSLDYIHMTIVEVKA